MIPIGLPSTTRFNRRRRQVTTVLVGLLLIPSQAWAFIPHWDPLEAFFIRQFAYLFWTLAMIYFILALRQEKLIQHRGFRWLVWAGVFFALWNINSFIGQLLGLSLDSQGGDSLTALSASESREIGQLLWFYYLTKLDHFLLAPAFIFFYLGMRALSRDPEVTPL